MKFLIYKLIEDRYAKNSIWMILDRVLVIFFAFFWSVVLARSLGLQGFGEYSVFTTIVGIAIPLSAFGVDGIVGRYLSENAGDTKSILLAAFLIKFSASFLCFSGIVLWFFVRETLDWVHIFYISIILFHSLQIFDSFHQVCSSSIYVTIIRLVVLAIFGLVKLIFFLNGSLNYQWALIIHGMEFAIYFCLLVTSSISFKWELYKSICIEKVRKYVALFWSAGGILFLSGVADVLTLKIDIIMLSAMSSLESVAIYSVASRISESGYFFAAAIATSYLPKLVNLRSMGESEFDEMFLSLLKVLLAVAFCIIFGLTLISYPVIKYLYGEDYIRSYLVILIHMLANIFIFFRAAFSKWFVIEDLYLYFLILSLAGMLSNVVLNYILIPKYDYFGAAIATVCSYSISSIFGLLCLNKTRMYIVRLFFMLVHKREEV